MIRARQNCSGRPQPGEYADYAQADIDFVQGEDILETLATQLESTLKVLEPIPEEQAATLTYGTGKWNLKEVVGHLSDDERIFAYRGLCALCVLQRAQFCPAAKRVPNSSRREYRFF
jgi:hypothetical protein